MGAVYLYTRADREEERGAKNMALLTVTLLRAYLGVSPIELSGTDF